MRRPHRAVAQRPAPDDRPRMSAAPGAPASRRSQTAGALIAICSRPSCTCACCSRPVMPRSTDRSVRRDAAGGSVISRIHRRGPETRRRSGGCPVAASDPAPPRRRFACRHRPRPASRGRRCPLATARGRAAAARSRRRRRPRPRPSSCPAAYPGPAARMASRTTPGERGPRAGPTGPRPARAVRKPGLEAGGYQVVYALGRGPPARVARAGMTELSSPAPDPAADGLPAGNRDPARIRPCRQPTRTIRTGRHRRRARGDCGAPGVSGRPPGLARPRRLPLRVRRRGRGWRAATPARPGACP